MALQTSKIALPSSVATTLLNKAKDVSTIAALCPNKPKTFEDEKHMVFYPSAEADVVEEGAAKGSYEQKIEVVNGKRVTLVTTTRVSNQLKWADEDNQLEIISNIIADQNEALSRALDYIIYHAINPKSGEKMSTYTALTAGANTVTAGADVTEDIDNLSDALLDYNINGLALSRAYASKMRKKRVPATGMRLYPEIPLSLNVGNIDGIPAATSGTVDGRVAKTATGVLGIMGDFSLINWGMVRDIYSEIIEYGDPDNTGRDLKGHNEIAFRTESVLGYAVFDPKGFAVLKAAGVPTAPTGV